MAGKSNKAKNRKGTHAPPNSTQLPVSSDASANDSPNVVDPVAPEPVNDSPNVVDLVVPEPANDSSNVVEPVVPEANGVDTVGDSTSAVSEVKETEVQGTEPANSSNPPRQGELHLYPVSVKTLGGDKLELQLNPGDSVMDVRQFLLDAPETCFFTCYDLLLHAKGGAVHHLEDYNEISEVADITSGDCSLEMVAAYYDDRSVRAHVHRTKELLSLSTLHASLSTSLALQHETSRSSSESAQDSVKADVPELDGFGFMEDVTGSLNKLFFSSSSKEIKCVESIVFSSFNPPPSHRRLVGDLIYLDVTTLEGSKFCITGTTRMFYVNSSTGYSLDPRPSKGSVEATTLIGLLQRISSKFKKAFREILEQKAAAHPFENVQSLLPPNSWLGSYPLPEHKRDAARAENALTLTYGSELIGMQRDWNEELQSCREFPHSTPQERILRDRALYKVTSDFVDAATAGAIGVINRCIPPINPTDPECFHMYVHNNIFFSFAVDADLEQLPRKNVQNTSLKSNSNAIQHDSNGKTLAKSSDGAAGICNGVEAKALKGEEKNGVVDSLTDVSAEIQLADSEQATYASANNDLKGTKAYQEADVSGLYNLAMAIIDYRGHRVVAQSVLPGILQGDKSDSLLYGSVDNGKKICWNEEFHLKVLEAAKCLHLKEHTVLDESGNPFKLAAPVECKGIVGSDDRHYLLDLMRVTPRDANYTGAGSRFCILRPELIRAFCQAEVSKKPTNKSKSEDSDCLAPETSDCSNSVQSGNDSNDAVGLDSLDINKEKTNDPPEEVESAASELETSEQISFNPNVFTEFKLAGSPEEIASDEDSVRKASSYLTNSVLPKFIQDLCTLEVSPMDGQTLTEALHAHGINVRYIGKVAEGTKHMPHLWDLCTNEVAVRAAKHLLKDVVRDTDDHELGPSVAHFFNCFFGTSPVLSEKGSSGNLQRRSQKKEQKSAKGKYRSKNGSSSKKSSPSYMGMSSEGLWSDITEFAKIKYQFDLPEDARIHVKKVSVIRNLCQKVGISLASRKYDLNDARPFQTSDILNLQPVVKHSIPLCSEARDLVETGKVQLAEGMLGEAYTAFSEAFSILQQVTGPMHREVANCCRYLAMVLYHAGDMAGAIMQQHKELIINERCLGLDHPDTAHSYGNMALFYHGLNQTELALRHMARALLLLSLSSGPDHPDVAATFINVAMMYQDIGKMDTALRYLQEALKKNERLLGEEHIQTAVCYHALAIAFNCMGAYKLSHQHEKKTYEILVKQLGEEDSRTRDSQNWMKTFKMRELQMNAQKQKGQTLDATAARKAVDILKGLQAAAAAGGSRNSAVPTNKSLNAAMIGEAVPRGRGVDERAARAAAAVRKKADAKRQMPRSHVAQVQPVSQLLNIRSPGVVTESKDGGEVDRQKKEIPPVSGPEVPTEENVQEQQNQAPVGLGKGLGSLDSKRQKAKPNVAS